MKDIYMNNVSIKSIIVELRKNNINLEFNGDSSVVLSNANSLSESKDFSLSFYRGDNANEINKLIDHKGLIIISYHIAGQITREGNYIITDYPDLAFCLAAKLFKPKTLPFIHHSAVIADEAKIASSVKIGANVVVGPDVEIGENVIVENSVSLNHCIIGDSSHIFPGVRIGSSGLGSHRDANGLWHSFPHFGGVRIGKNVIIQDNCVIARGTLNDTIIQDGTQIGPMTCIAHGVVIEKNVFISQAVIIAGSALIEEDAIIFGHASIRDGVIVGKNSLVGLGSVVVRNVSEGNRIYGNPAKGY